MDEHVNNARKPTRSEAIEGVLAGIIALVAMNLCASAGSSAVQVVAGVVFLAAATRAIIKLQLPTPWGLP